MRDKTVSHRSKGRFTQRLAICLKGTVIACLLRVLHEFLGKRCHVGILAIGVAFSEQFAEVGECLAGVFRVDFIKEGGDAAIVQLQFAILAHAEADGVEIGFEAGLEEQAVVEVVGKVGVGFFNGVEGMLRLCLGAVIEVGGIGAGEGIQDANFFMQGSFLFLIGIFYAKQRPDAGAFYSAQRMDFSWSERNRIALIFAIACHDEVF